MHSFRLLASAVVAFSLLVPANAVPDVSQFEVGSLPGEPWLPPSWAGRLPVPHTETGNSLFFWLFQAEDAVYDDNLIIWFNGGPGCSSLIGLTTGNGPILFQGNSTRVIMNPYSWTKFGHVLYVDQPVGTGYATASEPYPAVNHDIVTTHLYDWLKSFLALFSHLQSKQIHLVGESWAGIYVPYLASVIVNNQDSFPIDLHSMTIGDGSIGNAAAISATIVKYLQSQQSLLQIPDDILDIFVEANEICGFNDVLKQATQFPPERTIYVPGKVENGLADLYDGTCNPKATTSEEVYLSIHSSCYGPCATFSTASNHLSSNNAFFDVYDISHDSTTFNHFELVDSYFGRADVQTALNVLSSASSHQSSANSTSASEQLSTPAIFQSCSPDILSALSPQQPQAPVESILPDLVTSHNISLHIYFGEYDFLLNHYGAELTLQNTTWNGRQGFSSPLSRPFYPDNAAPSFDSKLHDQITNKPLGTCPNSNSRSNLEAGKWASERGVTYHLFYGAGHSVFLSKPREMFAYMRDVVIAKGPLPTTN